MCDDAEGDPRIKIIYEEAVRGWSLQSSVLDELRSRTGVLLAAASVSASLLGAADLETHKTFTALGTTALIAFCAVVILCIKVLWPRSGWTFTHDAQLALTAYVGEDCSLDETRKGLAIAADEYRDANDLRLSAAFGAFRWASFALGTSIVLWLIDLN